MNKRKILDAQLKNTLTVRYSVFLTFYFWFFFLLICASLRCSLSLFLSLSLSLARALTIYTSNSFLILLHFSFKASVTSVLLYFFFLFLFFSYFTFDTYRAYPCIVSIYKFLHFHIEQWALPHFFVISFLTVVISFIRFEMIFFFFQ